MYYRATWVIVASLMVLLLPATASNLAAGTIPIGPGVPLDELLHGGHIVAGDKLFVDFTYAFTGNNPPPEHVNVIPIVDDDGNFGIRFQGGFIDLGSDGASDALITYSVHVTDRTQFIVDAHLVANANVGPGTGFVGITESFLPTFTETMEVFDLEPGPRELIDWVDFPRPVRRLPVQKDIILFAADRFSVAQLSFVDQTFSQVPEPGSFWLMALPWLFLRQILRCHNACR
jgi:hypothetical protein